jgi:retron-type reverse transcriptase
MTYKQLMPMDSKQASLLFDVKGFFDNVNHARLAAQLHNMGFAEDLVAWAASFLADRRIKLKFNEILSEDRLQPVGVPQGSPLSPVLSIAYTAPLLGKMANWNNSSLGMYIDDGYYLHVRKHGTMSPLY